MAAKITASSKTSGKMSPNKGNGLEGESNEAQPPRPQKKRPALKVRYEPPTLEDAIYAAQGLTEDVEQQIEFAADLMDLPVAELRSHVLKAASKPPTSNRVFVPARSGLQRAVVIETTGRPRMRRATSDSVTVR
jgi:hypothetical protein